MRCEAEPPHLLIRDSLARFVAAALDGSRNAQPGGDDCAFPYTLAALFEPPASARIKSRVATGKGARRVVGWLDSGIRYGRKRGDNVAPRGAMGTLRTDCDTAGREFPSPPATGRRMRRN